MSFYSEGEMERTMKVQEVILRAMAKRINWWQAAEILGISARQREPRRMRDHPPYRHLICNFLKCVRIRLARSYSSSHDEA